MIQAILFDLDGVLVDAVEWHFRAFNRALATFGYQITSEEHQALYNGLPTLTKLELLSQKTGFPRNLHQIVNNLKQAYTQQIIEEELIPNPKLTQLLYWIQSRGMRMAVVTNSVRQTLDLILEKLEISQFFEFTLSQEEVRVAKPDPAIYESALKKFGLNGDQVVIAEDSIAGIAAARKVTRNLIIITSPSELTIERVEKHLDRGEALATGSPDIEIVIPMAGEGSRFRQRGYQEPKPLIPIFGRPMIDWAIENLNPSTGNARFTFLCQKEHLKNTRLESHLKSTEPTSQVISVNQKTEGAACTVLLAADSIDLEKPLLIANVDQWLSVSLDPFYDFAQRSHCDGLILTFPASETKWSYAKPDAEGRVWEVAEKRVISPFATVGIYYFKKGRYFVEAAQNMIRQQDRTNGEFYVCPVYNHLIQAGKKIHHLPIEAHQMHGLGTPEDLDQFIRWTLKKAPLTIEYQ